MGYKAQSRSTKLQNAAFLDLNRNELSKQILKEMDLDQAQDEENIIPTKKGRKRNRKEIDLNDDDSIKKPVEKKLKTRKKDDKN